jgi:hypothetical protein
MCQQQLKVKVAEVMKIASLVLLLHRVFKENHGITSGMSSYVDNKSSSYQHTSVYDTQLFT